mgnify:CR=1 FL=1
MEAQTRRDVVYLALAGFFVINYAGHTMINRFLGLEEAHRLVDQTARTNVRKSILNIQVARP